MDVKKNANFEALKNAHLEKEEQVLELSVDMIARGKSRYGSK